jgi:guanosine-3',5'-bis(diphosphate) 3'-pyrophosphohydrolase
LIRDITTVVAEERVNISAVNTVKHDDHTMTLYLTLETEGLAQLSRLLLKMEGVRGVISITRTGGGDKTALTGRLESPNKT